MKSFFFKTKDATVKKQGISLFINDISVVYIKIRVT